MAYENSDIGATMEPTPPAYHGLLRNGALHVELGWKGLWQNMTFYGGPFRHFASSPYDGVGICLTEHRQNNATYHLPIDDFSIPTQTPDKVRAIILAAADAALNEKLVYVGCAGGWGRTGIILSLIAKAAGVDSPISFVRQGYAPSAVETPQQTQYVNKFDVTGMKSEIERMARRAAFRNVFGF